MKKILILIPLINFLTISVLAQVFPGDLTIHPFAANSLEPRLGFLFQTGNELRLDAGNSMDIYRFEMGKNELGSLGVDMFTYSLLRSEKNFHFPVDAIDYLFGLNFCYKKSTDEYEYGARLRLSHISAHLVDGNYDKENNQWKDGKEPKVYSREFVELIPYLKLYSLRLYAGITYLYHVDPVELGKDNYQLGFDYFAENYIAANIHAIAGYDFKLTHLTAYNGNHSLILGIKWGDAYGKGLSLYFNYFSGKSIHGELYFKNVDYSAIGINFEI